MENRDLFKFNPSEKQKKIIKGLFVAFIIIFAIILFTAGLSKIMNRDKTATVKILVAPTDAIVQIGGETYGTDKEVKLTPGDYNIFIKKDGFNNYSTKITLKKDDTYNLYEYLTQTDENGTFYKDNLRESSRAQEISDRNADLNNAKFNGTDPIWNITPYENYKQGIKITAELAGNTTGNTTGTSDNTSDSEDEADRADQAEDSSAISSSTQRIIINIKLMTCSDERFATLKQNAIDYLKEKDINLDNYTVNYTKAC